MSATETSEPLSSEQALRLAAFARACKAATRVVALYPASHPNIQASLERVRESAERLRESGSATLTILPDTLLFDHRTVPRPDSSIGELAALLHAHMIGELNLMGEFSRTAWHTFLTLLSRSPEEVREQGGIARAWMAAGGGPIELRLIDYTEVLRDRSGGLAAEWDRLVANYLEGELTDLDDAALDALFDIAGDRGRFKEFTERLVTQASEGGHRGKKDVVLRVLQAFADFVARDHADQLDRILHQIAGAVPQLTPDLVVTLVTAGVPVADTAQHAGIDLAGEVRARIGDATVAEFVAASVARDQGATERLALAFQSLVPESTRRGELLDRAREELEHMSIGKQPDFPDLWKSAEKLLTSYSDSSFVPEDYARELSTARAHAIEVERVSDDPPERISTWLASVNDNEVRKLDQQLLLDLLRIETREDAWCKVLGTATSHIEHLVLIGNITFAQQILDAIVRAADDDQPFHEMAREALAHLHGGQLMKHVLYVIRHSPERELAEVSTLCRTLGPKVIGALAEALASEQSSATIRHLRDILLSFGAAGRAYADDLRASPNPAVRRAAIELLRAFGGADALPDLAALLDDTEPGVQRDALRAIVQIGTDEAYGALHEALKSGTPRTRDAMMHVLASTRDERAAPLFIYILEHTLARRDLANVCLTAIDGLGRVGGDAESVASLRAILYRRRWWAPFRTARLRLAAARALRATGSALAGQTLEEAANDGPRSTRRAARTALASPAPESTVRRTT